jgi:ring-1,2-phenylacetyl-CoA epoxidase subunit PaaC
MNNLFKYCLRIADNSLILGHRLGEYSSRGPFLEEDLAITNTALDHIGLAEAMLHYAGKVEGAGRTEDDLAYKRSVDQFYNNLLVEHPNTDFAYITVRQFLMDVFNFYWFKELSESKDETIAALTTKSLKEVTYHLKRSTEWMIKLGNGTKESHSKMQTALNHLFIFTEDLLKMDEVDEILLKEGISTDLNEIKILWEIHVLETCKAANLNIPISVEQQLGGRQGKHTPHLSALLEEMQYLPSTYPDAKW